MRQASGRTLSRSAQKMDRRCRQHALVVLLPLSILGIVACGSRTRPQSVAVTPGPARPATIESTPAPVAPQPPAEDPVITLIAMSDRHFKVGQKELDLGHVE